MQRFKRHILDRYGFYFVDEIHGRRVPRRFIRVKKPLQCPISATHEGKFDYVFALSAQGMFRASLAGVVNQFMTAHVDQSRMAYLCEVYRECAKKEGFRLP